MKKHEKKKKKYEQMRDALLQEAIDFFVLHERTDGYIRLYVPNEFPEDDKELEYVYVKRVGHCVLHRALTLEEYNVIKEQFERGERP